MINLYQLNRINKLFVVESRKRKAKNWEENDFYDSDEDTFLDRTGTIEKKRENRMKAKQPTKPETYQSLVNTISIFFLYYQDFILLITVRKRSNFT